MYRVWNCNNRSSICTNSTWRGRSLSGPWTRWCSTTPGARPRRGWTAWSAPPWRRGRSTKPAAIASSPSPPASASPAATPGTRSASPPRPGPGSWALTISWWAAPSPRPRTPRRHTASAWRSLSLFLERKSNQKELLRETLFRLYFQIPGIFCFVKYKQSVSFAQKSHVSVLNLQKLQFLVLQICQILHK